MTKINMKNSLTKILGIVIIITFLAISGFFLSKNNQKQEVNKVTEKITVFYSPTCGCCGNYISYLKQKGYLVERVRQTDLRDIKIKYKIPSNLESCHTSVIENYVVEGHIPVEVIGKLLTDKPDIAGIALSGMPPASPGMGGSKNKPFLIHAISKNGNDLGIFMKF